MNATDWLRLLTLSLLWGGSFFFVSVIVGHLPALTVVWLRVALAAVALAGMLVVLRMPFPPRRTWSALAVMGALNNAVPFTLFVLAQGQIGGGPAAILNATTPLFTLVVAALATRDERLSGPRLAGLAAGFAGVCVMMGTAALRDGQATLLAQGACLVAALSYGLAAVWGRRFRGMGLAPLSTAFGMLAAASVMLAPLVVFVDHPWTISLPELRVAGAVAGLALFSTALAYILYFRLLATAGAVNLALVTFLIPVTAIALGMALLDETLLPRHLVGLALIAAGLLLIDGRALRRRP